MNILPPDCTLAPRYTERLLLTEANPRAADTATIVGQLAHELRQPLSAMEAIAYHLHLTVVQDPNARQQLDKLRQLIEQAGWILSDAVHFLQSAPARPALHDVHELLEVVLSRLSTEDQDTVFVDLAESFPLVNLDLSQMQHLLTTALRFCLRTARQSYPVEVATYTEADRAIILFSTEAPGLDAQSLDSLFSPFEDHPAPAAGLGLASVRRIAEAHGGSCDLSVDAAGELRLRVALPIQNV